jgi:hypothetical protein
MTWETEVTVTVLMERLERMERAINDDEGMEGRFFWRGVPPRTPGKNNTFSLLTSLFLTNA